MIASRRTGIRPAALLACTALVAGPSLAADTYDCTILPKASSVLQTTSVTAPFSGTLIGDYDAVSNPTGTSTLPGLFGGSGNNPIPYSASFVLGGDIAASPTGVLEATIDLELGVVSIAGLAVDLLGGSTGALPATLNINYSTFRTVNPSSLYPGGVTIPVPLGDATVSALAATQAAPATGTLTPVKGGYLFAVAVPVVVTLTADLLGTPIADGVPTPGVLPLSGTIALDGDALLLDASFSNGSSQTQPVGQAFDAIPLALPTVIPAGATANLLMSGTVAEVSVESSLAADLAAGGLRRTTPADLNGDGVVGGADLAILLDAWGTRGPADLNGDGVVGGADLAILLDAWG
ncbi:MAG: Dockerin type domain [Planctomycetota bacterium]|jgi:hypothetical protein